jgi:predicted transcriptional regulator
MKLRNIEKLLADDARLINFRFSKLLRKLRISDFRIAVIRYIAHKVDNEPVDAKEVADAFKISTGSAGVVMANLETLGYLVREARTQKHGGMYYVYSVGHWYKASLQE